MLAIKDFRIVSSSRILAPRLMRSVEKVASVVFRRVFISSNAGLKSSPFSLRRFCRDFSASARFFSIFAFFAMRTELFEVRANLAASSSFILAENCRLVEEKFAFAVFSCVSISSNAGLDTSGPDMSLAAFNSASSAWYFSTKEAISLLWSFVTASAPSALPC